MPNALLWLGLAACAGFIAGYLCGKNTADQDKQHSAESSDHAADWLSWIGNEDIRFVTLIDQVDPKDKEKRRLILAAAIEHVRHFRRSFGRTLLTMQQRADDAPDFSERIKERMKDNA